MNVSALAVWGENHLGCSFPDLKKAEVDIIVEEMRNALEWLSWKDGTKKSFDAPIPFFFSLLSKIMYSIMILIEIA